MRKMTLCLFLLFGLLMGSFGKVSLELDDGLLVNIYEPFWVSGDTLYFNAMRAGLNGDFLMPSTENPKSIRGFQIDRINQVIVQDNSKITVMHTLGTIFGLLVGFVSTLDDHNPWIVITTGLLGYYVSDLMGNKDSNVYIRQYDLSDMDTSARIQFVSHVLKLN